MSLHIVIQILNLIGVLTVIGMLALLITIIKDDNE